MTHLQFRTKLCGILLSNWKQQDAPNACPPTRGTSVYFPMQTKLQNPCVMYNDRRCLHGAQLLGSVF